MKNILKKSFRKFYNNLRFNWSANNHPIFIGFYKYFYKPKQDSLSDFLDTYSKSKLGDFTVVQIGANDGITHDPIHKFIKRDRWKGVLLEPQKYVYDTFLRKIYAKNEGIQTLNAALGEKNGTAKLYKIGFSDMRWATGLASFDKTVVQKAFDSGLVKDRCKKHQITIPSDPNKQIISDNIPIINVHSLLQQYNISNIDLLQIDTEGFDYQIIRLFDITKTQPKAIVFENAHLSDEDKNTCHQLLNDNHYKIRHFGSNTMAIKAPSKEFERFFK